jgi:alanine-synthesizing transaminase
MFSDRTNWKLAQNRLTLALDEARVRGQILDLTVSNPTRVGLRYDAEAILAAFGSETPTLAAKGAARMGHPRPIMDYDPQAKGLRSAREAVAGYYLADHDVAVDPEQIVLTTSTSEGYSFVFRLLCNAGDELLVPKPSYPLFEFLADLQDVKLLPYPLIYDHGWQMDFHSLEKAVTARTRGVVVVHPNNPTGSYVKANEANALNTFCRDHGLAIIVDEVFLDYQPNGRSNSSDAENSAKSVKNAVNFAKNSAVLTFTLSGLSKISALPQMKVAWVVTSGPDDHVSEAMARLEVIADTYLSMNAPVQWTVPTLLAQRKSIQQQLMQRVRANLSELDRQLAVQQACSRLEVEGGWYAVLRVPVTQSDEELAIELVRKKGVLVHPGHFYDFPSDGYLVVSLIGEVREFQKGLGGVLDYLNSAQRVSG